jgi:hypothetical protein
LPDNQAREQVPDIPAAVVRLHGDTRCRGEITKVEILDAAGMDPAADDRFFIPVYGRTDGAQFAIDHSCVRQFNGTAHRANIAVHFSGDLKHPANQGDIAHYLRAAFNVRLPAYNQQVAGECLPGLQVESVADHHLVASEVSPSRRGRGLGQGRAWKSKQCAKHTQN